MDQHEEMFSAKPVIKVVGVGGGGGNAVNRMIENDLKGVEYVVINTDCQVLRLSKAENRIQIGRKLTKGLGAGADPEIGKEAALENIEEVKACVDGADLVFITAGMGGGTGTGAAPIVAKCAKENGALVVGIVTKPFNFEGRLKLKKAQAGISNLLKNVDSLIVIPNERLKYATEEKITLVNAFEMADNVLKQGVESISELINVPAFINLDFADVRSVMKDAGYAHMGVGRATGPNKAEEAAMMAIQSPLLETSIDSARGVIISITSSPDIGLDEVDQAATLITQNADPDANIIWGAAFDETLEDSIKVTVIATGFESAKKGVVKDVYTKPVVEGDKAPEVEDDLDDNSGLFRNEYAEGSGDSENVGDGISDSDFDDILSLLNKK